MLRHLTHKLHKLHFYEWRYANRLSLIVDKSSLMLSKGPIGEIIDLHIFVDIKSLTRVTEVKLLDVIVDKNSLGNLVLGIYQ